MEPMFKLMRPPEYAQLVADGVFFGSPDDVRDGYVHLSTAAQWPATRAKWFAADTELWLVTIDAAALGQDLRWEASTGGALFPHLYRPLRTSDVVRARPLAD